MTYWFKYSSLEIFVRSTSANRIFYVLSLKRGSYAKHVPDRWIGISRTVPLTPWPSSLPPSTFNNTCFSLYVARTMDEEYDVCDYFSAHLIRDLNDIPRLSSLALVSRNVSFLDSCQSKARRSCIWIEMTITEVTVQVWTWLRYVYTLMISLVRVAKLHTRA